MGAANFESVSLKCISFAGKKKKKKLYCGSKMETEIARIDFPDGACMNLQRCAKAEKKKASCKQTWS